MAANQNKIEVSAFCTDEARRPRFSGRFAGRVARAAGVRGASMLVKLGVCCAAAALVLVIKISSEHRSDLISALEGTVPSNESELDEQLGKLKFVELPGIIEVFSSEERTLIGFEGATGELLCEGTLIKLIAKEEQAVSINASCEVRETGEDPLYGPYVQLDMSADALLTVYGLGAVVPEKGQRLIAGDELGRVGEKRALYASVKLAGRPSDPAAYLNLNVAP